jgi:ubiquitin-protein ligase
MEGLATKRIIKDYEMLRKNKEELASRGIYFFVNEENISDLSVLIVPHEKHEGDLISPYTFGFYMFKIGYGVDFPMSPPKVTFHPQQNYCRMHPNYYTTGKVCLSVINTWASNDWSPSTSTMSLINVLEERFNENGICFEPSFEMASKSVKKQYNQAVEYAKYKVCILDVFENTLFQIFKEEMCIEIKKNFQYLMKRLADLKVECGNSSVASTPCYGFKISCDYSYMIEKMNKKFLAAGK